MVVTFLLFFVVTGPETMADPILGQRATTRTVHEWLHKRGYDKPLFFNVGQQRHGGQMASPSIARACWIRSSLTR
jgi:hypothetical protein